MRIYLTKGDKLFSYKLPEKVEGNYWLDEIDNNGINRNIINISSGSDGNWKIISNNDYYLAAKNQIIPSVILENNSMFSIHNRYSSDLLVLYACPTFDNTVTFYNCSKELEMGITIGKNTNATISCSNIFAGDNDVLIKLENNKIMVNVESSSNAFINNERIAGKVELKLGEKLFYLGLNIIFYRINGEYVISFNNNYNNVKTLLTKCVIEKGNEQVTSESKDDKDLELYSKEDYFYRKPRFMYSLEEVNINVEAPPAASDADSLPMILTVGPMLTMSMTSAITFYTTINNINNSDSTYEESIPQLILSGLMLLSFLVWPLVTSAYQKALAKKAEKKRIKKYNEYIDGIINQLNAAKEKQTEMIHKSYPNLEECERIINNKEDRLWEKRIFDDDFLIASIGKGTLPMEANLTFPEEGFTMETDKLLNKMNDLKQYNLILENVPVPYSFKDNYISAFIGKQKLLQKEIKNVILQLFAFHSYESLKLCVFTTRDKEKDWEYLKLSPHLWSNDKSMRYFAANEDEYKEVTYHLDKIVNERLEAEETSEDYNQSFVIIVDSYTAVRNLDLFNHIINSKKYLGFSLIILNDRISNLPDQCQTFIELDDAESKVSVNIANSEPQKFNIDTEEFNIEKCISKLADTPLELRQEGAVAIPKRVSFLEMYGLGKIEQFNSKKRWEENTAIMNMSALVGIGNNGEKISLDVHEKFHGPHGLIAGMTGSGKSEFIITYILSLAVNYHPDEVQFILIDYKGGGLAGAFENQNLGIKLPHLVGVITNLDKNEINRSFASIESELKRRQRLFNKARELSEESTIDIYKYQKMYREGLVDEPVSHLFIIADEFAELKTQQPEFMEQLITTARIGRSLGVHLILATQKPSGVVDSQIWSNTRFRVCLRVQEKSDSTEVIKRPDAAYLTDTGRFYLQVGFNEIFVLGQSAYSGAKYIPSDSIRKNIDTAVDYVNDIGYVTKSIETKKEEVKPVNYGEESINLVKYLSKIAEEENIKTKPLWLSRIPANIYVNDLVKKYHYTKQKFVINPIIGEYDVPAMQEQRLLTMPFNTGGNALVYGSTGSGKENFISTLMYSTMIAHTPEEANFYIVDFGSESLKYYDDSPFVGDIVYANDSEKIDNLFKMIQNEMATRKKLFNEYNGEYLTYCLKSGKSVPNIFVVINSFENFLESYSKYEETLNIITRESTRYGIYFVLTFNTPNCAKFKLKQNFGQVFTLNQNSEDDFSVILGNTRNVFPSKIFGRGLIKKESIYEFQTAFAYERDLIPEYIKTINKQYSDKYKYKARKIPVLPETVSYEDVSYEIKNPNDFVLGIEKDSLNPILYDFDKSVINIITSLDYGLFDKVVSPIILQLSKGNDNNQIIIDAEEVITNKQVKEHPNYTNDNFDKVFKVLLEYIEACKTAYKDNNNSKSALSGIGRIKCVIIGLNTFKSKLSEENQNMFDKLFEGLDDIDMINYIIVDTVDKFKKFNYDTWFKDNANLNNGIFIGNGLGDQTLINVSKRIPEMKEEVPYNFGFVINRSVPSYVKFIEKI